MKAKNDDGLKQHGLLGRVLQPAARQKKKQEPSMSGQNRPDQTRQKNLQTIIDQHLEQAWEEVQDQLYCYELPYPEIGRNANISTACINMNTHQITINPDFITTLNNLGMDYPTIFRGVLSHEAAHYKIMPWDTKNLLMMLFTTEKICHNKNRDVTNYFTDVCINLELMLNKGNTDIHELYKHLPKGSDIDNLLSHLYVFKTGFDFREKQLKQGLKTRLKELSCIEYTNNKKVYANLSKFAEIIKDLIPDQDNQENKENKESVSGMDKGFGIEDLDRDQIDKALGDIAGEINDPGVYRDIDSFAKGKPEQENQDESTIGPGNYKNVVIRSGNTIITYVTGSRSLEPGVDKAQEQELEALVRFYTAKAENYLIRIEDKEAYCSTKNDKSVLKPWGAEDEYSDIDPFNSYGKVLPGITKSWEGGSAQAGHKKSKQIPDLLVMIDSSGSMPHPGEKISNAVLGGVCAARQYIKKQSSVGVINFSTSTQDYGFFDSYSQAAKHIIAYQGGGTLLRTKKVKEAVAKHYQDYKKELDIMLITDGGIFNMRNVMDELQKRQDVNRITILDTSGIGLCNYNELNKNKIRFYDIQNEENIPDIVIDEIRNGGIL